MKNEIENNNEFQEFLQLKSFRDYWINYLTKDYSDNDKIVACDVILNRQERMKKCLENIQSHPGYKQKEIEELHRLDTLIRVIKKKFAE